MDKKLHEFLTGNRVSVLGILRADKTIHSAALHFSQRENPLDFFFITEKDSRKCRVLLNGSEQNASLVIGFSEEEFATFQAEGKVAIAKKENLESGWDVYTKKYPDRSSKKHNPEFVLLHFTPYWWRYRDLKPHPMIEISSEK